MFLKVKSRPYLMHCSNICIEGLTSDGGCQNTRSAGRELNSGLNRRKR